MLACAGKGGLAFLISNFNIKILAFIWIILLVIALIYNIIGYFILLIENDINIDLSKIKVKLFRNIIEDFIGIKNSKYFDNEKMKKYFATYIYVCLLSLLGAMLLFII